MRVIPYLLRTSGRRRAPRASPVASIQEPHYVGTRSLDPDLPDYFSMLGASRFTFLMMLRPFTVCISARSALVRRERLRRRWLLPPLVRTSLPLPVSRKRFEVALCVFSLYLPDF